MKIDREHVKAKTNGRCAFCGCHLTKGWHISPINPVNVIVDANGEMSEQNNDQSNMLAACKNCGMSRMSIGNNGGKRLSPIEDFRRHIHECYEFISESPYFKRALRYGLIKQISNNVVFYFETLEAFKQDKPM